MGMIRGGLFVIASFALFLSFFAGNVFLTLDWSLEYDTLRPELTSIIKDIAAESEINLDEVMEENFVIMESYCQNNSEYVFSKQEYIFVIPCDIVSQGSEAVIEQGINNLLKEFYYKEYDCGFWECVKQSDAGQPFVLVSEKARDYWNNKFYLALVVSLILIILMFFLIETKHSLFTVVGCLLIISSLPFMKLNWLLSFISDASFLQFFTIFFIKAYNVFLISFIIGLALLGVGIGLKFFNIGFKISDFFSKKEKVKENVSKKDIKEIVKEEISKKK